MTEKAAAKSVREAKAMAATAMHTAKAADVKRKQHETATQKTVADAQKQARTIIQDAQDQSGKLVAHADAEVRKIRSIANWFRSFWDALRISAIRKSLWKEIRPVIEGERRRTADVENRLQNEIRRRASLETRLSNATQSMQALIGERDRMRRQRDKLLNPDEGRFEQNNPKIR